jgi:hypothetical protein
MRFLRLSLAILALVGTLPAGAAVLYKSVDAKGTVMFSDVPPPQGAKLLEQREIRNNGSLAGNAPSAALNGMPIVGNLDDEVAKASAIVDQAEHALALARRQLWSSREGLQLVAHRRSRADEDRVEFYKRELQLARRALCDLLKEKQLAALVPGAPYVASR